MKKLITITLAITIISITAHAQKRSCGNNENGHPKKAKKEMIGKLNWSEEQKLKVKQINADFKTQMKNLKSNDQMTVGEFNTKKDALQKDKKAKIQSLLTTEQKKQIEETKIEKVAKREAMKNKKMNLLKEKLQLSDQQMTTLKESQLSQKTKMEAVKTEAGITKEKKKEKMKHIKEETKATFAQTLTLEQKTKLAAMKKSKNAHKKDKTAKAVSK